MTTVRKANNLKMRKAFFILLAIYGLSVFSANAQIGGVINKIKNASKKDKQTETETQPQKKDEFKEIAMLSIEDCSSDEFVAIRKKVWALALEKCPKAKRPFTPERLEFANCEWDYYKDNFGNVTARNKQVYLFYQMDDTWFVQYWRIETDYNPVEKTWSSQYRLYDPQYRPDIIKDYKP